MTPRIFNLIFLVFIGFNAFGARIMYPAIAYRYSVDLRKVENDQIKVELHFNSGLSRSQLDTLQQMVFCLPKIVPGIYGAMNFGQNLTSIEAFNNLGEKLEIVKLDQNRWKIHGEVEKLTYFINDGWEEFNSHEEGRFLSAESSFQENKVFVINHNTLFGYFQGFENKKIELEIRKPKGFYGATSLSKPKSSDTLDYFAAKSYRQLVDNPVMYALPDTTKFKVGDAEITVAMFSDSGKKLSKDIAEYIRPLLENQKAYLGGKLPVDHYTFMLYHNENPEKYSSIGDGLEHSNSTLILMYMPLDIDMIKMNVYGIASHEFFHTLLPLGLHSEEIAYYDFNDPKLSKHIWLYEGTTEYFTLHMPISQKVISMEAFLESLEEKIKQMNGFGNEKSLAYLSENAISNQPDYYNFYLKGAMLNVCLDIELRSLSKGKYGVRNLIEDLMKEYGSNKPFKDDALFDEMTRISGYPELRKFFTAYVEGTEVLPLKMYFLKAGIDYNPETSNLSLVKSPSKAQLALRKSWIGQ